MLNKNGYQSLEVDEAGLNSSTSEQNSENIESSRSNFYRYGLIGVVITALLFCVAFTTGPTEPMMQSTELPTDRQGTRKVMHISDTHVDFFFDPTMSQQAGVCHTCAMSGKDGKAICPSDIDPSADERRTQKSLVREGYSFGRYGCNPPEQLWYSLHQQMQAIDPDPRVVIFTGDISPHGYPDDNSKVSSEDDLHTLCETKFLVTEKMVKDFVNIFPNTKWAFAMGNNDHFPKDTYWAPYMNKLADMFYENKFFTKEQYDQFREYGGSNFVDVEGVRYLSIDFTIFAEDSTIPPEGGSDKDASYQYAHNLRTKIIDWVEETMLQARKKGLSIYIVGHQPLSTNKGKDELDVQGKHYDRLKDIFEENQDIIKVGLFGHRNLAGVQEVLSNEFLPLFPSITVPGVSPRGKNQPCFHVLYQDEESGVVVDFEQWFFDLLMRNKEAKELNDVNYLGHWHRHTDELFSWQTLSGTDSYTKENLEKFLEKVLNDENLFFKIETWEKAGYIGSEVPESYVCRQEYDKEEEMMTCMFPNQNKKCWSNKWLGS